MMEILYVRIFGRYAGVLGVAGSVRAPEDWRFEYDAAYLAHEQAVALSVSLPLQSAPFEGAVVRNWFGNLLPEGMIREAICARLKLPVWDDFALLAAIGGECAGAVSLSADFDAEGGDALTSQALEAELLQSGWRGSAAEMALVGTPRRLSLAGAQDKIAVVVHADGVIRMPATGELTTHILKPDSHRLPGLRDLEALGLTLARALGLPVAHADLRTVAGEKALLVARYDRAVGPTGDPVRLHQEDFCQALGHPSEQKYEVQGGPSLAACANLIRFQLRLGPLAIRQFLDWVIYNILIGNADAHAKNLALLTPQDGRRQLAPFYDLVPTIAVPERYVDRVPAMNIGQAKAIDQVGYRDWEALATSTGYKLPFVRARLRQMAEEIHHHLPDVVTSLVNDGAERTLLDSASDAIARNVARAVACLKSSARTAKK